MSTKKKKAAKRPVKSTVVHPKAVTAPSKNRGLAVVLVLLVLAGLVAQAGWVFYRNRKAQITLHYEAAMAPRGPGKGQVTGARHMAANAKGELFYLQGGGEGMVLQKFSRNGEWLAWISGESAPAERLTNAFAVGADADGGAWVVERGRGRLKHYDAALHLKADIQLPGTDLCGVAVAPDGKVWVADYAGQLLVVDPATEDITRFTGEKKGRLRAPFRLTFDPTGELYVLDFAGGMGKDPMVRRYDAQGELLKAWDVKNQPVNDFMDIAWNPLGYVVLNDTRPDVVEAQGFRFYLPDGKLEGIATLTDTGQNIRAIPAFAIAASGDWYLDLTPLQQGCGRLSWTPLQ